ncbi:MAG: hypothetical protein ABL890_02285 [Candidatus Peribacteraceae bacterium]
MNMKVHCNGFILARPNDVMALRTECTVDDWCDRIRNSTSFCLHHEIPMFTVVNSLGPWKDFSRDHGLDFPHTPVPDEGDWLSCIEDSLKQRRQDMTLLFGGIGFRLVQNWVASLSDEQYVLGDKEPVCSEISDCWMDGKPWYAKQKLGMGILCPEYTDMDVR